MNQVYPESFGEWPIGDLKDHNNGLAKNQIVISHFANYAGQHDSSSETCYAYYASVLYCL